MYDLATPRPDGQRIHDNFQQAIGAMEDIRQTVKAEALRLRDEYFAAAKQRSGGKIIYRLIDVRDNGKGAISIVWCKVYFYDGPGDSKKQGRLPIAKGQGSVYAPGPVTRGMDHWFVELFQLYEPQLAVLRDQMLYASKIRKLLVQQQRKAQSSMLGSPLAFPETGVA
ncbi:MULTISPECIES: conjugative transfer protein MobI(A/C) [Pseudomonas]|uniref:conjugative transfer protein MobI(A/C) n=1 Tax=Pseudomonas TaxID=286 RepID=UPI000D3C564B|nr:MULTISPECIES: conjugative transfer protein MobI(A/C) [Pseudomonas]RAU36439.1 hypothetical protein DBY63_017615 [Pseudomonas sp. RIT 411]UUW74158.1 hypothetical protein NRG74_22700 [Pseudomonas psychrotolerans]